MQLRVEEYILEFEGVKNVAAFVHIISHHADLMKHGIVCDAPPLGFFNGDGKPEQHPFQPLNRLLLGRRIGGASVYQEGEGSTKELS
uniref:Uncharacterized protein n=1 Tax=Leersia perrieri TaxID=77586 RepID=A0A0D9WV00_9ORYZ